ncbi:MAG: hemerythrin domain-containing protein, partial [Candidatus Thiodiazotropha sp.]
MEVSTIENLKGSHAEMLDVISDLRAMLTREQLSIRPNAMTAHKLICELADKMKGHMSEQDKSIYPDLLIQQDPKLKSMAWGFLNGQKPMRKQFDQYNSKWLKNCDFNFSEEFVADTFEIFDMIEDRIKREESILIPTLENSGV